jgi:conjugal transfer pilus assembly protein TraV
VGITQPVNGEAADPEKRVDQVRLERLAQLLKEPRTPMVTPPRIVRVLILPYKGNGDLFMARYAYLQVEPAGWVLPAVDEDME